MIGRALRRLGWTVVVVWFVATATFAMVHAMPGDPARAMLGPRATPEAIADVREAYCLDRGVVGRYGCWLGRLARGDLGESYVSKRPVTAILGDRAWATLQLALAAIALQLLVGVPLGVWAAVRRGRWPDRIAGAIAVLGQSAPSFVVGTVALYVVAYRWDLLPLGGYGDGGWDRVRHLVLPAATLAVVGVAFYIRITRGEMIDALRGDHVRTARAKGVPEGGVVWRHALRPAAGPLVANLGVDLGLLAGGAVVVEYIFGWPGVGRETVLAVEGLDMPVILGVVIVTAVAIAVANLLADLAQLGLDPRLRDRSP